MCTYVGALRMCEGHTVIINGPGQSAKVFCYTVYYAVQYLLHTYSPLLGGCYDYDNVIT